jgi:hypothetical protein
VFFTPVESSRCKVRVYHQMLDNNNLRAVPKIAAVVPGGPQAGTMVMPRAR